MGIQVIISFVNQFGEPIEESGKIHITQNANVWACWTGTNEWVTFSAQSQVSFVLNNIGCNPLGCCGSYHITVYLPQGTYAFQVTKDYNDSTYEEVIEITETGVSGSEGIGNLGVLIKDFFRQLGTDIWIIVILILVIAIILSVGYAVGQFTIGKIL